MYFGFPLDFLPAGRQVDSGTGIFYVASGIWNPVSGNCILPTAHCLLPTAYRILVICTKESP